VVVAVSWRRLATRPIGERERGRAFAGVAAVLSVAAIVLLAIPDGGPDVPRYPPAEPAPNSVPAPPPSQAKARAAARGFLADYLPFVYGRTARPSFRSASPELAARLASSRVRVSPAAPERHPKLIGLHSHELLGESLAAVTAEIADGPIQYAILLTAERQGAGGWRIVRVGAD
jgi:hypothetical protein